GLLPLELGEPALGLLQALHDLELDLLQVGLAPGELLQLGLERLGVLRGDGARVEARLVAGGALTHLFDVALGLGQLPPGVGDGGAFLDLGPPQVLQAGLELGERLEHGQAAALVVELGGTGVERLHVEQTALVGHGGGGHWAAPSVSSVRPLSGAPRRSVHGSVTVLLTTVRSTAPAARASSSSRAAATGSQGHSLAQCVASMR